MGNSKLLFEETFTIRASEIDFNQKATLSSICNFLQEIAGNHARSMKFDITDLQENKMTWVLHRLQVEIDRFPKWRETIKIKTWPSGGDGLRAHRDFLIYDENNEIIGRALSYWLIIDLKSRRPIRIPEEIRSRVPDDNEHVLSLTSGTFKKVEDEEYSQNFRVRKTDLDLNRHLNNVRYIEWAISSLPDELSIDNIDIKFMNEAQRDEQVALKAESSDEAFFFEASRADDQKTLALMRVGKD